MSGERYMPQDQGASAFADRAGGLRPEPQGVSALTGAHPSRVVVDLCLPDYWIARHFWAWRKRRAFGIVVAVSPRSMTVGVEIIAGTACGLAAVIGPFWLGFATLKIARDSDRNPQGEDRDGLRAEHESAGRQASPTPLSKD